MTASVACRQTSDRATVERVGGALGRREPVAADEPRPPLDVIRCTPLCYGT